MAKERSFRVYNKRSEQWFLATGLKELASLINEDVKLLPKSRIYEYNKEPWKVVEIVERYLPEE